MTIAATMTGTVPVTTGRFAWKAKFTPLSAKMAELVRSDPVYGHRAAVDCAGMPGQHHPVRWAMTDDGMVVRAPKDGFSGTSTAWREVFAEPSISVVDLLPGDRVRFSLLAVPERCLPPSDSAWQRRQRGRRVLITDDDEIEKWLRSHLAGLDDVDFESCAPHPVWSQELNHLWRAVRVTVSAVVGDPVVLSELMVGRSRAYGFGLPVFEPA